MVESAPPWPSPPSRDGPKRSALTYPPSLDGSRLNALTLPPIREPFFCAAGSVGGASARAQDVGVEGLVGPDHGLDAEEVFEAGAAALGGTGEQGGVGAHAHDGVGEGGLVARSVERPEGCPISSRQACLGGARPPRV
jgi:hypothetical protein